MKSFRIQLLIAGIVALCGFSLMGVIYIVFGKQDVVINPGVVVCSPSPISMPATPMRTHGRILHTTAVQSSPASSYVIIPSAPVTPMQPLSSVWESKNARVQVIGGGLNQRVENISHSTQQRGIQQTSIMPMTTFVAMASVRQVAAPAATEAPAMAKLASGPHRAPGPPTTTDLQEIDQLVEHPVPAGASGALIAMALLYACRIRRKE